MNDLFDPKENEKLFAARESYTGRGLTESQFEEAWSLTGVLARGIKKSGSFHEKLTDYAHAFSRTEKFDAMKGEVILRDLFKTRYGQTLNAMREGLASREKALPDAIKEEALTYARQIEPLIRDGATMPFFRAYDRAGAAFADHAGITESTAKKLMTDAYRDVEKRELYEIGKALEAKYHVPARDAEREQRDASRETAGETGPKRRRSMA